MDFSNRTPKDLTLNPLSKALEAMGKRAYLDLTLSNPTQCGFDYPADLLRNLASLSALKYEPSALGLWEARQAVAEYLKRQGQQASAENLVLTASTSESYSYLFKLLCDPGDSVLVPTPGYPLLEHLGRLEGIELLPYSLLKAPDWPLNWKSLESALQPNTKAIVLVNPHNPTGSVLGAKDLEKLGVFCRDKKISLISDEVFSDYLYPGQTIHRIDLDGILTFRLGGLSKSLGLPQLKLSWTALEGPDGTVAECRERLELIADTYLSVNGPVQWALRDLLDFAPSFRKQVLQRVLANREFLVQKLGQMEMVVVWPAQGGWYALVEWLGKDLDLVEALLDREKVLIQPGGLYDFAEGCFLVVSLLPQPRIFQDGVIRLESFLKGRS